MANNTKGNPHAGSSFDDYLKEDGLFEEVQVRALKRALVQQLDETTESAKFFAQRAVLVNVNNTQAEWDRVGAGAAVADEARAK